MDGELVPDEMRRCYAPGKLRKLLVDFTCVLNGWMPCETTSAISDYDHYINLQTLLLTAWLFIKSEMVWIRTKDDNYWMNKI